MAINGDSGPQIAGDLNADERLQLILKEHTKENMFEEKDNIYQQYLSNAKVIIGDGRWKGAETENEIITSLVHYGYERSEIKQAIAGLSPSTAGIGNEAGLAYAEQILRLNAFENNSLAGSNDYIAEQYLLALSNKQWNNLDSDIEAITKLYIDGHTCSEIQQALLQGSPATVGLKSEEAANYIQKALDGAGILTDQEISATIPFQKVDGPFSVKQRYEFNGQGLEMDVHTVLKNGQVVNEFSCPDIAGGSYLQTMNYVAAELMENHPQNLYLQGYLREYNSLLVENGKTLIISPADVTLRVKAPEIEEIANPVEAEIAELVLSAAKQDQILFLKDAPRDPKMYDNPQEAAYCGYANSLIQHHGKWIGQEVDEQISYLMTADGFSPAEIKEVVAKYSPEVMVPDEIFSRAYVNEVVSESTRKILKEYESGIYSGGVHSELLIAEYRLAKSIKTAEKVGLLDVNSDYSRQALELLRQGKWSGQASDIEIARNLMKSGHDNLQVTLAIKAHSPEVLNKPMKEALQYSKSTLQQAATKEFTKEFNRIKTLENSR